MKKQSFFAGTVILTISSIICKILGAIYKIPLTHVLGTLGTGIYYIIFPVYAFLLTFVSNSFTMAVSRIVSSYSAKGEYRTARKVFVVTLVLLCFLSIIFALLLALFSRPISSGQGLEGAYICYIALAPAIVAVAIGSSFKGYFQGLQNMTPTAVSQVLEQIFKLSIGFLLASILSKRGAVYATLGAIVGVTMSEVLSTLYFVVYYIVFGIKNKKTLLSPECPPSFWVLFRVVIKTALPFTLTSVVLPLSMLIDSFLIVNILKSIGFDKYFSTELLGFNSGIVGTLVSLPSTLSISICMTIVPYISFALSKGNIKSVSEKASLAIKLTMIVAIPCTFVFGIFSSEVVSLLYNLSSSQLVVVSTMLTVSSINVLYLSLLQITTSLLQAVNRAYIPVISLSIALVIKVVLEVILISSPYLNILGAVMSTGFCYLLSSAINIYKVKHLVPLSHDIYRGAFAPVLSSIIMCFGIYFTLNLLKSMVSYSMSIVLSFISGMAIFVIFIFVLQAFSHSEKDILFGFVVKKKT